MMSAGVAQDGSITLSEILLAGSWKLSWVVYWGPLFLSMWISLQGFLGFITAQSLSNKEDCSKRPRKKLQDFLWPSLTGLRMPPLPHWSSKALRLLRFKERSSLLMEGVVKSWKAFLLYHVLSLSKFCWIYYQDISQIHSSCFPLPKYSYAEQKENIMLAVPTDQGKRWCKILVAMCWSVSKQPQRQLWISWDTGTG